MVQSMDTSGRRRQNTAMEIATTAVEVGVRELKANLSKYLARVQAGDDAIVTDHGRPVARLSTPDDSSQRLANLISAGIVRPPKDAIRHLPDRRIVANGSVSELVAEQRR